MIQKLLIASHNTGKVAEYAQMLADLDINLLRLDDVGIVHDVAETGTTFEENAVLKACAYAKQANLLTLADDSGLEVDALDGAPGVYTARYGGIDLTYAERYSFLLENLRAVPWPARTARFRCVIALAGADGKLLGTAEGVCPGMIATSPAGEGGFGYDPVFYLPELDATMAQIPAATKHRISHRGRALRAMRVRLEKVLRDVSD